ncbi:hypothetical protein [Achromobacter marplatensis]|uniref:Uncharacterized protein n=1 Tax=Achromobacter marplatensis TaxID=470868 RepID=A0AA43AYI6_9BURK|nr:hypothetical protein [Achromobacter marplatensis]MDH2051126.1 hypothetical protein [Achromobacter marplatensis]
MKQAEIEEMDATRAIELVDQNFILYEPQSGRILSLFAGDEAAARMTADFMRLRCMPGRASLSLDYVDDGEVIRRLEMNPFIDGRSISNLPATCSVQVNDVMYECSDGIVELEFEQPGKYRVIVRAFPFLDLELEYENPA